MVVAAETLYTLVEYTVEEVTDVLLVAASATGNSKNMESKEAIFE